MESDFWATGCQCAACNMKRLREQREHEEFLAHLNSPEFAKAMEEARAALASPSSVEEKP